MLRYTWTCTCCGKQFNELPVHWNAPAPAFYDSIPEQERETRVELMPSACVIDGRHFFVRGLIEIPLRGHPEMFSWGAWMSLPAESMRLIGESWDDPERDRLDGFSGVLDTGLPFYPETVGLKATAHLRKPPMIPRIMIDAVEHPLALEQRDGMTLESAIDIAQALLPRH